MKLYSAGILLVISLAVIGSYFFWGSDGNGHFAAAIVFWVIGLMLTAMCLEQAGDWKSDLATRLSDYGDLGAEKARLILQWAAKEKSMVAQAQELEDDIAARQLFLFNLTSQIADQAGSIWASRSNAPTNGDLREIREYLFALVISSLRTNHIDAKELLTYIDANAIRDVVERQLKSGELDVENGKDWQRQLVAHVYRERNADKPFNAAAYG